MIFTITQLPLFKTGKQEEEEEEEEEEEQDTRSKALRLRRRQKVCRLLQHFIEKVLSLPSLTGVPPP